ncbi:hypothetical protein SOCE26_035150 [Sorangium cellulosum]|uniref:Uncharacterized protein n=1 Tax=Sorangium cellulosum TaxID=56 RepID=A0A2L0ERY6_SORCE|nr:hypothetical protein [Sorangium cellulosum]AUX42088.1 hypothetical protein SOCE26_035150 [Sorangium cellulosum]
MRAELDPARRAARAGLHLLVVLGALPGLLGAAPPPGTAKTPASASAPARATVALSGDPSDATFQRIRDELRALDVRITTGGAEDADARVVVARRRATIALAARHGGGELEVAVRRGEGPEILALAAVELLRARLLHRDAPHPPATDGASAGGQGRPPSAASPTGGPSAGPAASAATSPASPAVRAPASSSTPPADAPSLRAGDDARRPTRFAASVGPALLFSGGEAPMTPALSIGVSATSRGWYVGATGTTTLGGTSWSVPGGRLEHGVSLLGAAAGGGLSFASGRGLATLGAGASVLRLRYQTFLAPVFDGGSGTAWAAVPHLEAALRWFVHDHAGFRLGGLAGAAFPAIDIRYPERNVGASGPGADTTRYGRPLLAVSLSLEARL